jgi:hypothetical protein
MRARAAGTFSAIVLAVCGVAACDSVEPAGISSLFGNASVAEMRSELGTYSVTIIPTSANQILIGPKADGGVLIAPYPIGSQITQVWRNGTVTALQPPGRKFSGTAMNNLGDVVGVLDTVVAVWWAGASFPSPVLPDDPASGRQFMSYSINDRGEVLLRKGSPYGNAVWKAGELRSVDACRVWQINNQGTIMAETCDGLNTDTWFLTKSPFGGTTMNSGKLAGATCDYPLVRGSPARLSNGHFLNDSNEVIDSDNAWVTAAGCVKVGRRVEAFNARGILLISQEACLSCIEVLTLRGRVPLDSLIGAATGEYQVAAATGINDAGQIVGFVVRKSTGERLGALFDPILLNPIH